MYDVLRMTDISAGYGPLVVIDGLSLRVERGETVAILGRNGAGKTTLLETLMGFTRLHTGRIVMNGEPIDHWPTWKRSRAGLALVPQQREIFPSLSVEENLTTAIRDGGWRLDRAYDLFPRLAERRRNRGNQLSGGEQQMLAVARALMGSVSILLLDEPLEGLAPIVIDGLLDAMQRVRNDSDMTMLLVEQHAMIAMEMAPRSVALVRGKIAYDGPSDALRSDRSKLESLVGLAH